MHTGFPSLRITAAGVAPAFVRRGVATSGVLVAALVAATLTVPGFVAAQGYPDGAVDVTDEEIEAVLASPDGGTDRQIRILDMGSYNLAVGVIHREATEDDGGPVTGIIHSQVTETYVIRSGSGTLVTGGTIPNPVELPSTSEVVQILNGPTVYGENEGGRGRVVEEGDVIIIPAGVFHGWTDIDDHVTYLSIRPDPDKVLEAGYVNPAIE